MQEGDVLSVSNNQFDWIIQIRLFEMQRTCGGRMRISESHDFQNRQSARAEIGWWVGSRVAGGPERLGCQTVVCVLTKTDAKLWLYQKEWNSQLARLADGCQASTPNRVWLRTYVMVYKKGLLILKQTMWILKPKWECYSELEIARKKKLMKLFVNCCRN